jgi:hypothetical protein
MKSYYAVGTGNHIQVQEFLKNPILHNPERGPSNISGGYHIAEQKLKFDAWILDLRRGLEPFFLPSS